MNIKTILVEVQGVAPLLMHNVQLADPFNQWSRQLRSLSGKRNKTDEDLLAIQEIEYQGGLYYDDEIGPYLPAEMIEASLIAGAKAYKQGELVKAGVQVEETLVPLIYPGPRLRDELFADSRHRDSRMVMIQRNRVLRTRPRFNIWSLTFTLLVAADIIAPEDVRRALDVAGRLKALGDFRPRFGRFILQTFEEVTELR